MQTNLADFIRETPQGREADRILRACVHCGFCTATCPTYQLLGDELDGPRGRIYQIKQVLEGAEATPTAQQHLDRCLSCMSCMTTCPSGVDYHRLLDIGREVVDERVERPAADRLRRWMLRKVLPFPGRVAPLVKLGQAVRPLVPAALKEKVPPRQTAKAVERQPRARRMLILDGCVQPAMTPRTNVTAAAVLDSLGVSVISAAGAGCCGALSQHLTAPEEARAFMRANIDAWWPHVEDGAEAVITTASGCGVLVKDYGHHLRDDPAYADKAARISELTRDLCEVVQPEDVTELKTSAPKRIAFHPPCTLQHGQKLKGLVERLLVAAGFELVPVADAHMCCGSAGTYSILQADLSQQLLGRRLDALQAGTPELIVTANIGCQLHLLSKADVPVMHWIELFEPQTAS
ncbi:MAG: glycolate oxidase subunit GlcF [Gammaproteobacteria bacterium]|nr:glycolate oxidase subunit GlcF [Gammaproteobacteria bacterium]